MCLDLVFHCVANNILILSVACPVASGPCAAIYLIKMNVHSPCQLFLMFNYMLERATIR